MSIREIERIAWSPSAFETSLSSHTPVVIRGLGDRLGRADHWQLESLAQTLKGVLSQVATGHGPPMVTNPVAYLKGRRYVKRPFDDYAKALREGRIAPEGDYLTDHFVAASPQMAPMMNPANEALAVLCGRSKWSWQFAQQTPTLWVGPPGVVTPLHYDRLENVHAQFEGRKRWVLLAPHQREAVYCNSDELPTQLYSPVDVLKPDLDRYPRFTEAQQWSTVVEPDEMLYVPSGWWHHVHTLERSVSMTFWFWSFRATQTIARLVAGELMKRLKTLTH